MEKTVNLSLRDVGDLIFRITQRYLFRKNEDLGLDVTLQTSPLQETMILRLLDETRLLVKTFPHKNYSNELVYRIEVYKTREGDMRGNKIAFLEASQHDGAVDEIHRFVQSYLAQLGF
ncbi:MAG: hypothetical protein CVV42_04410 [Candidatus Riflebacteria bacterium HGW-Riflebacteria-2]|jgi:hypothetical protein|nr:MAG: hypothetical protein CVV42_04410 [Candidatus Riflebacteria bacterium HGW-Riflebacteria-2]